MNALDNHQVLIVEGYTGCGKTTQVRFKSLLKCLDRVFSYLFQRQVPQYILDSYCQAEKRCNIVVTQPRRIAAQSVAERVCRERSWNLGDLVGFQVNKIYYNVILNPVIMLFWNFRLVLPVRHLKILA